MASKKPVPLQFERTLPEHVPSQEFERVEPGSKPKKAKMDVKPAGGMALPPSSGFDCRLRFEKKGRGGQPVFILYAFAKDSLNKLPDQSPTGLARTLKTQLSCGGTIEEKHKGEFEVILQFRDEERLTKILTTLGLKAQRSGG